jgi:Protein of unknown function (DUF2283)
MTVPPHLLMPLANRQASEPHEVHESVPLYGSALDSKVSALDSIVLDFDRHGRLIGLEIIGSAP